MTVMPEPAEPPDEINQELETGLRCISSQDSSSWARNLVWLEYYSIIMVCYIINKDY